MEVDSPPATRCATEGNKSERQGTQVTTNKAIQEIETLLEGTGLLIKVYDTWKHMKNAAARGRKLEGSQIAMGVNTQA